MAGTLSVKETLSLRGCLRKPWGPSATQMDGKPKRGTPCSVQ